MKKFNFSLVKLFLLTAFVAGTLSLTGCKTEPDPIPEPRGPVAIAENDGLIGSWTSSYGESFKITKDAFECVGTYKGDSLVVLKDSETTGTIFVKYTVVYDWNNPTTEDPNDESYLFFAGNPDWGTVDTWYPLNKTLIGKWYAISYKDLTDSSINISGAYKADGKSSTDSLEEAVEEFTIDNGYFDIYSECTKQ